MKTTIRSTTTRSRGGLCRGWRDAAARRPGALPAGVHDDHRRRGTATRAAQGRPGAGVHQDPRAGRAVGGLTTRSFNHPMTRTVSGGCGSRRPPSLRPRRRAARRALTRPATRRRPQCRSAPSARSPQAASVPKTALRDQPQRRPNRPRRTHDRHRRSRSRDGAAGVP